MYAMESSVFPFLGKDKAYHGGPSGPMPNVFAQNPNDSTQIDKKVRIFLDKLSDKPIE
jgi:hypothetical protein